MASRANPYRAPGPWGEVVLAGWTVPLFLVSVGAEIEEEWAVQKGIGTNSAFTIWRGTKLIEDVPLVFEAENEAAFDALYELYTRLAPVAGKKPPTVAITNPAVNFVGVQTVARKKWKGPYPSQGRSWRADLTLIQYRAPKLVAVGPADPAKPPADPTAQNPNQQLILDLMAKVEQERAR